MNSVLREPVSECEAAPTVLLLDADPRNARLLAGLLGADGYRVEACRSGAAALLRMVQRPAPTAVILDLSPARKGDLEVVRRICAERPGPTLFIITADPRLARGEPHERTRIFVKPLDYPALLRALASA